MKTGQKLIQILVALTLLLGAIALVASCPDMFPNVAWNSVHAWAPEVVPANVAWNSHVAWTSGEDLRMPNVAWNSRSAWVPDLSPANVTWNSGFANEPGVFPKGVAWNS
jgi:hypothetical protein